jgi:hypothetical protein
MQKVRTIMRPATEGTHFTLAQARAAWREVKRDQEALAKKAQSRQKRTAKAR